LNLINKYKIIKNCKIPPDKKIVARRRRRRAGVSVSGEILILQIPEINRKHTENVPNGQAGKMGECIGCKEVVFAISRVYPFLDYTEKNGWLFI